jgi:hypothetical protein
MKSREQFIKFAVIYASAWLIGMVMFGLATLAVEIEWLAAIFSILGTLSLLFPVGFGFYAGVYSVLQFRNAYNAYVAGEDYNEYKTRIHYTLPFAFALGGFGFSFVGIALAIFLVWMLHKWARPIYDWNEMKGILLHRNGTSWKRTALTWVNVAFFVLVAIIPLVILGIIIGILYLLGKSGIVDGLFNMVTGTMRGGGGSGVSSAFNSCDNCAHYGVGGDGKCWHGYSNPAGRCPYYSEK